MVHAGVFRNVATAGIHPCSINGVSTTPVQNMACVCVGYSDSRFPRLSNQTQESKWDRCG